MISVENLVIKTTTKTIIKNATFQIFDESIALIKGNSGSGKTTLLNAIGLLTKIEKLDDQQFYFDNLDCFELSDFQKSQFVKENIGFVFQNNQLIESLTIAENIALPLKIAKENSKLIEKKLKKIMTFLEISNIYQKYPNEISGGQLQRAAIARALIKNPKYLFADEPTSALDDRSTEKLIKLFKEIKQEYNLTLIIATHDARLEPIANQIFELTDGKITTIFNNNKMTDSNEILINKNQNIGFTFFNFYRRAINRRKKFERFLIFLFTMIMSLLLMLSIIMYQYSIENEGKQMLKIIGDKLYVSDNSSLTVEESKVFFSTQRPGTPISEEEITAISKTEHVLSVTPNKVIQTMPYGGVIEQYWKEIPNNQNKKSIVYADNVVTISDSNNMRLGSVTFSGSSQVGDPNLDVVLPDITSFEESTENINYISEKHEGIVVGENYLKNQLKIDKDNIREGSMLSMTLYVPSYMTQNQVVISSPGKENLYENSYITYVKKREILLPIVGVINEKQSQYGLETNSLLLIHHTVFDSYLNEAKMSEEELNDSYNQEVKNYNQILLSNPNTSYPKPERGIPYQPRSYTVKVDSPENINIVSDNISKISNNLYVMNKSNNVNYILNSFTNAKNVLFLITSLTIVLGFIAIAYLNGLIMKFRIKEFAILKFQGLTNFTLNKLLIFEILIRSISTVIVTCSVAYFLIPELILLIGQRKIITTFDVKNYIIILLIVIAISLITNLFSFKKIASINPIKLSQNSRKI